MDNDTPTTLRDYAERFRVYVHCPACTETQPLNLMRWAQLVGWNTPLATLHHSLRCVACGNNIGLEVGFTAREDLPA